MANNYLFEFFLKASACFKPVFLCLYKKLKKINFKKNKKNMAHFSECVLYTTI